MEKSIAILHSGNLKDISQGGISEYVAQFIKYSKSNIILLGTENKKPEIKLFREYKRKVGDKEYIFIPINYSDRKPLSVFYFLNLILFLLSNFKFRKQITSFYAQRMEYVLPFFLFWGQDVSFAVHGSGKYASMFWGKWVAFIYAILERMSIFRSQRIYVLNNNNDFGVPYYKGKYKRHSSKILYTSVPVDQNFFVQLNKEAVKRKYNFSNKDKIILFFGRIEHNPKRVLLLPQILKKVRDSNSNVKMIVIGSGNDRNKLIKSFHTLGLNEAVTMFEHLNHNAKLIEIINCADVSVVCSSFEGICMSALESLSCKVPVVATDVGSIKDYLIEGYNGFFVYDEEDDAIINRFAEKILEIFNSGLSFNNEAISGYNSKDVIKDIEKQLLDWKDK